MTSRDISVMQEQSNIERLCTRIVRDVIELSLITRPMNQQSLLLPLLTEVSTSLETIAEPLSSARSLFLTSEINKSMQESTPTADNSGTQSRPSGVSYK